LHSPLTSETTIMWVASDEDRFWQEGRDAAIPGSTALT